jgi:hypothetical protein
VRAAGGNDGGNCSSDGLGGQGGALGNEAGAVGGNSSQSGGGGGGGVGFILVWGTLSNQATTSPSITTL